MPLPADFDRAKWLDPLTFEGLIGAGLAAGIYCELFRPSGFAKSIDELRANPRLAKLLDELRNATTVL